MGCQLEILRASYVHQIFSRHIHEDYAVGVIEDGAMGFRYRGAELVASKGLVNLVVPGEAHDGHPAVDGGWSYRMFYLPAELLMKAAGEISSRPEQPYFREGVLNDPALAGQIMQVHRSLEQGTASSLEMETMLLELLVSWISRHADDSASLCEPGSEHRSVNMAREFMEDCFSSDVSLEQLAALGGLSRFHFLRVFEKGTGITPHAYLMQIRARRAKSMLETSMRLADIAAACGFCDQSHLNRHFSRQFGITPGRYRNFIQNSSTVSA